MTKRRLNPPWIRGGYCQILFFLWLTLDPSRAQGELTAQWMTDLYRGKPSTKLRDILIPATHNSGSSKIHLFSSIAPGDPFFYHFARPFVYPWTRCQFQDIYQQLIHGIRKFDLRVTYKKNTPVLVHGFVGNTLEETALNIKRFIRKHPKEVILLEINIYEPFEKPLSASFEAQQKRRASTFLKSILKDHMLDYSRDRSFRDFWNASKSVMILEQNHSNWPNSRNTETLKQKIKNHLDQRRADYFHEISLTFTPKPNPSFFLKPRIPLTMSRRHSALSIFSKPIRDIGLQWLDTWVQEGKKINIVATDFVGLWPFAKKIIALNRQKIRSQP